MEARGVVCFELCIVQSVENTYEQICSRVFNNYDPFANILHYISININRFGAQRLEEELLKKGLDPLIEDILKS